MKRIITVLAVALVMAAMVAVMAAPAFARANHDTGSGSSDGQETASMKNTDAIINQSEKGVTTGGGPKEGILGPNNSDHFFQNNDFIGNP